MILSKAEVDRVAYLARLGLTPAETEKMRSQLGAILEYFEALKELNTDNIPPTAQVIAVENVLRPDNVLPSLSYEEATRNAPSVEDNQFKVKRILDKSAAANPTE